MRAVRQAGMVIVAVVALVALASSLGWVKPDALPTQAIADQPVAGDSASYRRVYFEPAVLADGTRIVQGQEAWIRLARRDDKIAVCGYAAVEGPSARIVTDWLAQARLELDGRRLAAAFIRVQPPAGEIEAGCIATSLPWPGDAAKVDITLTGIPLRR
jgi:hypothetical protein